MNEVLLWKTVAGLFFRTHDQVICDLYMLNGINIIMNVSLEEKIDLIMRRQN